MTNEILLLGLFTVLAWGASGYTSGLSSRGVGAQRTTFATQLTNLVVVLPLALLLPGEWSVHSLGWGAVAAITGSIGFISVYSAMTLGRIGVVAKLRSGMMTLVPLTAGIVAGERPGTVALAGVALIIVSVVMLASKSKNHATTESAAAERRSIELGLLSGVMFGIGLVALGQTTIEEGLVPLVSYRVAIAIILITYIWSRRQRVDIQRDQWPMLTVSGALAAAGDATFLMALQQGPISLVPALAALSPGVTAVLARWLSDETLRPIQVRGIVLGIVGVVLLKL